MELTRWLLNEIWILDGPNICVCVCALASLNAAHLNEFVTVCAFSTTLFLPDFLMGLFRASCCKGGKEKRVKSGS